MRQIGDAWEQVARLFKRASTSKEARHELAEAAKIMTGIARQEEQAWKFLHDLSAPALSTHGKGIR
jgi:hypothetical protein